MSLNVVDAVASIPNMCEMFHVPFQSGDDDVLREMGRCVFLGGLVCLRRGKHDTTMDGHYSPNQTLLPLIGSGYTVAKYMEIVDRIRTLLPDAAVTADVIVGFPGETEEQFQNTLQLMERVKFDQLNTAAYR